MEIPQLVILTVGGDFHWPSNQRKTAGMYSLFSALFQLLWFWETR